MSKLEDMFAGSIELTATELAYLRNALAEIYMNGGWSPDGENRLDFARRVNAKIAALKLDRMVTPDGSRLVSVDEYAAIVSDIQKGQTMKNEITEKTTLAELAVERARLGVTTMMLSMHPSGRGRMCMAYGPVFDCEVGYGSTEAQAIAAAFTLIAHTLSIRTATDDQLRERAKRAGFTGAHAISQFRGFALGNCGHEFEIVHRSDKAVSSETIACDMQKDHGGNSHSGVNQAGDRKWQLMTNGAPFAVVAEGAAPRPDSVSSEVKNPHGTIFNTASTAKRSERPRIAVLAASAIVVTCPVCNAPQPTRLGGYWPMCTAGENVLDWSPVELRDASKGDQHGADGHDCVHCGTRLIIDPGYMRLAETDSKEGA